MAIDLSQIGDLITERVQLYTRLNEINEDLAAVRKQIDLRNVTGKPIARRKRKKNGDAEPAEVVTKDADVGGAGSVCEPIDPPAVAMLPVDAPSAL